jgi:hypothetical protein
VLIDNSVLGHAVTHETGWVDTGKVLWGGEIEVNTGYAARVPVHSETDDSDSGRSVRYLAPIAMLAKRGSIELLMSRELQDEQWTQPIGRFRGYQHYDYSVFRGVPIQHLPDPDFTVQMGPRWMGLPSLEEQRQQRLATRTDPIFRELLRVLGPKSSQDAWHVATAEMHGCYCFLTMDFKLIRSIRAQSRNPVVAGLKTRVISPEEFGREFSLREIPPRLLSYHEASFPVVHDTNWPSSKRKPRKKKLRSTP